MFFCDPGVDWNPFDSTFIYAFSSHANFEYNGCDSSFLV